MSVMFLRKAAKLTIAGVTSLYVLHTWQKKNNLSTVSADWKPSLLSDFSKFGEYFRTSKSEQLRLINVQIFFRHGLRTPLYCELPGMAEVSIFNLKRFIFKSRYSDIYIFIYIHVSLSILITAYYTVMVLLTFKLTAHPQLG